LDDGVVRPPLPLLLSHAARAFSWRLSLGVRVSTRLVVAWTAVTASLPGRGVLLAAACACALYDGALARRLAHGVPGALGVRLALDAADAGIWTALLHGHPDLTAAVAGPLAVQWGLWHSRRALLVPAVVGGVVLTAGLLDGGRWQPMGLVWPLAGALCGISAHAAMRGRLRWEEAAADTARQAAAGRAQIGGQAEVAMGADSVLDLLARTAPIVAAHEDRPQPAPFAAWKAELAREHAARASYLMVALLQWERRHNQGHDLAADVVLRLAPGDGTLLLSASQVAFLYEVLERMGLRGATPVRVVRAAGPGLQQVIDVAGHETVLPADSYPRIQRLHPIPVLFLFGALVSLQHTLPAFDAVAWWAIAPVVACALSAAWWFQRRVAGGLDPAPAQVIVAALLIGAADATLSSAFFGHPVTGGMLIRAPFLSPLTWVAPPIVFYGRELTPAWRAATCAALAASIGAAAALAPALPTPAGMLAIVPWLGSTLFVCVGLRSALLRDAGALRDQHERLHEQAVADGLRRGRRQVVETASHALGELARRFHQVAHTMSDDERAEVARRLHEACDRLRAVDGPDSARTRYARGAIRHLDACHPVLPGHADADRPQG
jgi:hypothetical protein